MSREIFLCTLGHFNKVHPPISDILGSGCYYAGIIYPDIYLVAEAKSVLCIAILECWTIPYVHSERLGHVAICSFPGQGHSIERLLSVHDSNGIMLDYYFYFD